MSPQKDQEYFCDGIAEELINALSHIRDLRVIAQLISVKDGYHLWSEKFDREMEDIFAIQDEISTAIVDNLKLRLLAGDKAAIKKRHTDNLEAYNLYLKGLVFVNKPSPDALRKALDCFSAAIDIDPGFAPAYVGTAHADVAALRSDPRFAQLLKRLNLETSELPSEPLC